MTTTRREDDWMLEFSARLFALKKEGESVFDTFERVLLYRLVITGAMQRDIAEVLGISPRVISYKLRRNGLQWKQLSRNTSMRREMRRHDFLGEWCRLTTGRSRKESGR